MNTWKHQLSKDIQTLACIFPFFDTKSFTSKALFCGAVFSLINCPKHSWRGQYPVLSTVQSTPGKDTYQPSKTLSSRTLSSSVLATVWSITGQGNGPSYQLSNILLAGTMLQLINYLKIFWQRQSAILLTVWSTPGQANYPLSMHSRQQQCSILLTVQRSPGQDNYPLSLYSRQQLPKGLLARTVINYLKHYSEMFRHIKCPKQYWPGQQSALSTV